MGEHDGKTSQMTGNRPFADTVTIVTGGGSGIGQGVARRFAALGATVVIADIDMSAAEAAAAEVRGSGVRATAFHVDVANAASVDELIAAVVTDHGRIDHLVNSAGVSGGTSLAELTEAEYARVMDIDLGGVYRVSRAAAPHLVATGQGAIVNISSVMAWFSAKGYVAYSGAKAGVLGMTRALALDLGPNVRVNAISPGYIDTAIWQAQLDAMEPAAAAARAEEVRARHPVGRRGVPDDVSATAAFLCSHDASFITGIEIVVDGGMSANALALAGGY
ncbi:MAG TPA: SDR family oxidoreductase [Trueperaceae bacterium]|nr:SDR family oxidoreductase [Trueperaceae bacterium]